MATVQNDKKYVDFEAIAYELIFSVDNHKRGHIYAYNTISTNLCKLLIDKNPEELIIRIDKKVKFHKLIHDSIPSNSDTSICLYVPHEMNFKKNEEFLSYTKVFNLDCDKKVDLENFLKQRLFISNGKTFTIFDVIKIIRDKEGAHNIEKINDKPYKNITTPKLCTGENEIPFVSQYLIATAEYLIDIVICKIIKKYQDNIKSRDLKKHYGIPHEK